MVSPNPATRREHAGAAVSAVITAPINSVALSFTVASASGWPTGSVGPFVVIMDPGTITEEKFNCDSRASTTITVNASGRGFDGTTAQSHALNAVVYPIFSAVEADELNAHANATAAVHGAAGTIVGTTDSQVLTNKTISADNNTLSGIVASSFVLSNGSGNIDGSAAQKVIPAGVVVGDTDTQSLTNKTFDATSVVSGGGALVGLTATQVLTGKTISADNNTLSGIAVSSFVLSDGSGNIDGAAAAKVIPTGVVVGDTDTQTLTSKRITLRVNTVASSATPAINVGTTDMFTITALAVAITSMTSGLTGTPTTGQKLLIRIKDNATARAITWGASFVSRGATLPTTTVLSKTHYVGLVWNEVASVWDCVAATVEA